MRDTVYVSCQHHLQKSELTCNRSIIITDIITSYVLLTQMLSYEHIMNKVIHSDTSKSDGLSKSVFYRGVIIFYKSTRNKLLS